MRRVLLVFLICVPVLADELKTPSAKERYEALLKAFETEQEALFKDSETEAKSDAAKPREWPGPAFAVRFLELAKSAPNDPAATDALLWVVNRSMNVGPGNKKLYPHYRQAFELLSQGGHIDDLRVGKAVSMSPGYASAPIESFLRLLIDRSQNREVRGRATFALGKLLTTKAGVGQSPLFREGEKSADEEEFLKSLDADYLDYVRKADAGASEAEAETVFERAIKDYGDLILRRSSGEKSRTVTVGDAARSALHKLRDLAIGKVAPEIEGVDIEGKPLKLSDFRGKVVVLTFWATWCGPCMGLVPHERALVERLAKEPFVLLGINGDNDRERAKQVVNKERITWKSWWNGGPTGPITDLYSIEGWPTVYVLDGKGVIRHKEVIQDRLDEAVDELLKEMKAGKP